MKKSVISVFFLLTLLGWMTARAVQIEQIANPRDNGGWVKGPGGRSRFGNRGAAQSDD